MQVRTLRVPQGPAGRSTGSDGRGARKYSERIWPRFWDFPRMQHARKGSVLGAGPAGRVPWPDRRGAGHHPHRAAVFCHVRVLQGAPDGPRQAAGVSCRPLCTVKNKKESVGAGHCAAVCCHCKHCTRSGALCRPAQKCSSVFTPALLCGDRVCNLMCCEGARRPAALHVLRPEHGLVPENPCCLRRT